MFQYALKNPKSKGYPFLELGFSINNVIAGKIRSASARGFGGGIPAGLGYQTGWKQTSKLKYIFELKYCPFTDAPQHRYRYLAGSIGITF